MISIRRLVFSVLAGGLILTLGAASASAEDLPAIERATAGLALGLEAVSQTVDVERGSVVVDDRLTGAMAALDRLQVRHDASENGSGRAVDVHEMLMNGDVPGRLNAASKLASIAGVFERLGADVGSVEPDRRTGPPMDRPVPPGRPSAP